MRYSSTLAFLAFAAFGAVQAQEVSNEDIDPECQSVCSGVVTIAAGCNADDDERELNCICSAEGAQQQIPLCEACIASVGDEDGDDVGDLRRSCSFSSTTYTPGAMATSSRPSSNSVMTTSDSSSPASVTSTVTTTDEANSGTITSTIVETASSTNTDDQTETTTAQAGPAASVSSDGDRQATAVDEGAAVTALPMFGAGAGVALVALGML